MFAAREIRKQTKDFTPSIEKQASRDRVRGSTMPSNLPDATRFLQRNMENSYMQSIAAGRRTLGGLPTIQRKSACGVSYSSCFTDKRDQVSTFDNRLKKRKPKLLDVKHN